MSSSPRHTFLDDAAREPAGLAQAVARGTVVVTGNFDGVHRGHQALFARARAEAEVRGLAPVALTFDPHPRAVLGNAAPSLLTTTARRIELLERLGVEHVFVRRFDLEFARQSPAHFVERLLVARLRARVVIAGDNFRFGAKRAGDDALLKSLGPGLGFEAFTLEATDAKGPLSSTRVREAVAAGDVDAAAEVLGRPHSIAGVVEAGDQRGRTIGFPTANLGEVVEIVPANGVYAVLIDEVVAGIPTALGTGVMNIGVRPTVGGEPRRTLEAHLFDFDGDLYGMTLRVHFVARLRDERRFSGLDELKAQIARDAEAARSAVHPFATARVAGAYA